MRTSAVGRSLVCLTLAGLLGVAPAEASYASSKPAAAATKSIAVPASLTRASNQIAAAYSDWYRGIWYYQGLLPYYYVNHKFTCVYNPKDPGPPCAYAYQENRLRIDISNAYPATTQQLGLDQLPLALFSAALNNQATEPTYGVYGDGLYATSMTTWTSPMHWVFFCPNPAKPARSCLAAVVKSMDTELGAWEHLYTVWKNDGTLIARILEEAEPGSKFPPAVGFSKVMVKDLTTMSADVKVFAQAAQPLIGGVTPETPVSCRIRTGPPKC